MQLEQGVQHLAHGPDPACSAVSSGLPSSPQLPNFSGRRAMAPLPHHQTSGAVGNPRPHGLDLVLDLRTQGQVGVLLLGPTAQSQCRMVGRGSARTQRPNPSRSGCCWPTGTKSLCWGGEGLLLAHGGRRGCYQPHPRCKGGGAGAHSLIQASDGLCAIHLAHTATRLSTTELEPRTWSEFSGAPLLHPAMDSLCHRVKSC